jgi:hypothetical protein
VKRAKTATWARLPAKVRARHIRFLMADVRTCEYEARRTGDRGLDEDANTGRLAIAELRRAARKGGKR